MRTRHRMLLAPLLLIGCGSIAYEAKIVARQEAELLQAHAEFQNRASQLAALRQQTDTATRALAHVHRENSPAFLPGNSPVPEDLPTRIDTDAWLNRIRTIKLLFAERPELSIPELKLLSDSDWVLTTRGAQLDTDEHTRKSLAALRDAAKKTFVPQLEHALQQYLKANGGQFPPDVGALTPYFAGPVDPAALLRYEILRSGNISELPTDPTVLVRENSPLHLTTVVREKRAIDEDYDSRFSLFAREGEVKSILTNGGVRAWIDAPEGYSMMVRQARSEFSLANHGAQAAGLEQLAPYFHPPIPPGQLRKLIALEREEKR